jgi:hypothetical protein
MSDLVLFRSANHWLSGERLSDERKGKIQKMNAGASAIYGKKLSGERIVNLEKMSECPALDITQAQTRKMCSKHRSKAGSECRLCKRHILAFDLS